MALQFRVIGPFEVVDDGVDLTPSTPKLRQVLALLVLRHGRVVQTSELIYELWGARPPKSAGSTLQTYVYKLRRHFEGRRSTGIPDFLHTKQDGYIAMLSADSIDVHQFERLARQGRTALVYGDPESAMQICSHALTMWRGQVLGGVTQGDLLYAHAVRLEEDRLRTLETKCEAALRIGKHRELISELRELTITHPMHEGFYRQLMLALYRSDRRADALSVYQRLRRLMIDEAGLEPSTGLRQLHQALLAAEGEAAPDPLLAEEKPQASPPKQIATAVPVLGPPAQLPPDIADFVGHESVLRDCREWLDPARQQGNAMRVVTVLGMPGVGKTTFAARLAHLVRERFPDGQLFADLRGGTDEPASAASVLRRFLRAAGISEQQVPDDPDECATLFRTWAAGRKLLVVLDDAASWAHVRPLLPGGSGCAVVVTSRRRLSGLAGARTVELGPLSAQDGTDLLSSLVDGGLVGQRGDAELISALCGQLPLAIRCAGARLASTAGWAAGKLAQRLRPEEQRLNELSVGDLDVRQRFDTSWRTLSLPQRRTFTALGHVDEATITARQLDPLLGGDPAGNDALLGQLVDLSLLRVAGHDSDGEVYYTMHALARIYAKEQAREFAVDNSLADRSVTKPWPMARSEATHSA